MRNGWKAVGKVCPLGIEKLANFMTILVTGRSQTEILRENFSGSVFLLPVQSSSLLPFRRSRISRHCLCLILPGHQLGLCWPRSWVWPHIPVILSFSYPLLSWAFLHTFRVFSMFRSPPSCMRGVWKGAHVFKDRIWNHWASPRVIHKTGKGYRKQTRTQILLLKSKLQESK